VCIACALAVASCGRIGFDATLDADHATLDADAGGTGDAHRDSAAATTPSVWDARDGHLVRERQS
jgi:hypothetical protein